MINQNLLEKILKFKGIKDLSTSTTIANILTFNHYNANEINKIADSIKEANEYNIAIERGELKKEDFNICNV